MYIQYFLKVAVDLTYVCIYCYILEDSNVSLSMFYLPYTSGYTILHFGEIYYAQYITLNKYSAMYNQYSIHMGVYFLCHGIHIHVISKMMINFMEIVHFIEV